MKFRETSKDIDWVSYEYPVLWYVVEVRYAAGRGCGDIAIAYVNTKYGESPKEKDSSRGFTQNFTNYEDACSFASRIAKELNIPFPD